MPNIKIFHLSPDDKDFAAMHQPKSVLVLSKPDSQDSSSSPRKSLRQQDQEQDEKQGQEGKQEQEGDRDQDQEQENENENEKLEDGSRRKRKWEYCDDEASRVETPRDSNTRCYCPPRPPRKPKADPAMKRRAMWVKRSVVFLDVARDVESMFPPSLLQDFGKKIKKARS